MASQFRVKPRVLETSTITGTGTYTLAGAPTGYQTFLGDGIVAGDVVEAYVTDGTNWEEGFYTVGSGPATLARTTIQKSSTGGAAINWAANTEVECHLGVVSQLAAPRYKSVSIAGGAGTQVLTEDEQRCDVLELTGAITGNRVIEVSGTPWKWASVKNIATGEFTVTLKVNGQTGVLLPQGAAQALDCDGTDVRNAYTAAQGGAFVGLINGTIVQSRAGNAETIAVKTRAGNDPNARDPVLVVFRDQAATTGGYILRTITAALSVTISSGSTLGAVNNVPFDVTSVIFDDAGTLRLGVINATYGLDGTMIASSTAEGGAGAADSANTFYTGAAVASKPYCITGISTFTLAAVGTWGTAPSRIRLAGHGVPAPQMFPFGASAVQATTSGTSIDFTGIPSWAKRIEILPNGVSTNGTSNKLIQIGDAGGIENSGYLGAGSEQQAAVATVNYTTGFGIKSGGSSDVLHGRIVLSLEDPATNTWVMSGAVGGSNAANIYTSAGSKPLSAPLDRIRLTTVNGTDTFDAGSVAIFVE